MKFPNPIYEHRIISGLTLDQLARLEALLMSEAIAFTSSRDCDLTKPGDVLDEGDVPPIMLDGAPCLQIWWERASERTTIPLVCFAKSPKRDVRTGLWTVDLRIVVAIGYAMEVEWKKKGWRSARMEVGMYRTPRKISEAIDDALGLYTNQPNGEFVKVGEQHPVEDMESREAPPPPRPSDPDKPGLRTELHP